MDQMAIAERRQLRRKLSFWRVAALVFLAAVGFALYRTAFGESGGSAVAHVAQIRISGMITDDRELLERLERIAENDQVKALIVSISSPGGTTYGGERLFKAIRHVAESKPVVSDVRTLAASAGYMIATAGDTIVAGESSITGSIGVIFQYPQLDEVMKKIGVSLEEIKSSPLKAEPSPFHPASEEAKTMIRNMVLDSYAWFVDLVADRRKMPREETGRPARRRQGNPRLSQDPRRFGRSPGGRMEGQGKFLLLVVRKRHGPDPWACRPGAVSVSRCRRSMGHRQVVP
jgi:protease-4